MLQRIAVILALFGLSAHAGFGLTAHAGAESGQTAAIMVTVSENEGSDTGKLAREAVSPSPKGNARGKDKLCCGYALVGEREFALRFYWLALQERYLDELDETDLYTRGGFYLGSFPERFVRSLRLEGSGLLADGRIVNYAGRCRYGTGRCFNQLDHRRYPYGRGAGRRALKPFRSIAVDRAVIPLGEPIYIPEFDGLTMPDGSIHDGCVLAEDTGGGIRKRKLDFFVVSYPNFRYLLKALQGVTWVTPHIEHPRCRFLLRD